MTGLFIPSIGLESWRARAAAPDLQWKRGRSALELAVSWELAAREDRGLPHEVAQVLDLHDATRGARLLFGFPEHGVVLPGGGHASQTDLWAVLRKDEGWISLAVEGKAGEPFGPTVGEWLQDASAGKRVRLAAICRALGISGEVGPSLRYQLLHRSASAVIEAQRIGARTAVMLVQNFRRETASWSDFQVFAEALGARSSRGGICEVRGGTGERVLLAWADCNIAADAQLADCSRLAEGDTSEIPQAPEAPTDADHARD